VDFEYMVEHREGYIDAKLFGHEILENSLVVYEAMKGKAIEWDWHKIVYIVRP
jgi:hypothetical protein